MSNIEKINEYFHLPISFDKKSIELNPTIITDLELKETIDPSGTPLYDFAFQPKTIFGNRITKELSKFYTTNKKYLKETQFLLISLAFSPQDLTLLQAKWDQLCLGLPQWVEPGKVNSYTLFLLLVRLLCSGSAHPEAIQAHLIDVQAIDSGLIA